MQQADVRIGALDHLAVELEHQAQHAVRRRMLRPEIHRVVAGFQADRASANQIAVRRHARTGRSEPIGATKRACCGEG